MLDPVTLGILLAVLAVIVAIIFYLFSGGDERDFEKAFDENARKLLNQDREKQRPKTKLTKKKENKEKKCDKVEQDEKEVLIKENHEVFVAMSKDESTRMSSPELRPRKNAKKEKGNSSSSDMSTDKVNVAQRNIEENVESSVPSIKEDKSTSPKKEIPASLDDNKENNVGSVEDVGSGSPLVSSKRKKRHTIKKEDEVTTEIMEAKPLDIQPVRTEEKKKPKKKVSVINVSDLDSNKVLTRLASLEEIEPEYIGYLATYFHDSNAKAISLCGTIDALKLSESELKKKNEINQQARVMAEKQLHDHQRSLSELTMKVQALSAMESSNKQQMNQLNNIRLENDTLKSALTKSSTDAAKMRSELEAIKNEHKEYRLRIANLENELKQQVETNDKLQNQHAVEFESLRSEFTSLESSAHQMKNDLDEKSRLLNQSVQNNVNNESLKHVEAEKDEITMEFKKAKNEWKEKEERLMAEYTSLKKLVDDLNKEVAKFELFKKEQDALEKKLLSKETELAEKSVRLAAAETEKELLVGRSSDISSLERENTELKRCVEDLKKQLEMVVVNYKKEFAVLDATRQAADNEILMLKKAAISDATPPGISNQMLERLQEENMQLRHKNEELRKRNFKILDDVTVLEKQLTKKTPVISDKNNYGGDNKRLIEERQLVASMIGSVAQIPPIDFNSDSSAYSTWLKKVALSLDKKIDNGKKKDRRNITAQAEQSSDDLRDQIEGYKVALSSLLDALSRIESISNERECAHIAKIDQLQHQLSRAQISSLHATVTKSNVISSTQFKKSASKSDESDWEVVN